MDARFELMADGVGAGDLEGCGGNVGGMDFSLGQFFGKRDSNAARAGADIGDAESACVERAGLPASPLRIGQLDYSFDNMFGLGTRDQDGRGDNKVHAPEFLVTGDVLRGNAAGALGERDVVASALVGGKL